MGSRYLEDLADVCRRTGYPVIELDDWQHRARGSGGYNDGKPDHVMCHHTGSPPSSDGWGDANYCTFGDEDAPLANLILSRVPEIFVCAGGATNTNGSGDCPHLSPDTMNSSAIGIEASNYGGHPWPPAQQDAYVALCAALCEAYGIPTANVHSHAEWAPSRKVDPAGESRWAPGTGTWDEDAFRHDVGNFSGGTPPPEPGPAPGPPIDLEVDDVKLFGTHDNTRGAMLVGAGWRYAAKNDHETAVMLQAYGEPTYLSGPEWDLLAAMATSPSDGAP